MQSYYEFANQKHYSLQKFESLIQVNNSKRHFEPTIQIKKTGMEAANEKERSWQQKLSASLSSELSLHSLFGDTQYIAILFPGLFSVRE